MIRLSKSIVSKFEAFCLEVLFKQSNLISIKKSGLLKNLRALHNRYIKHRKPLYSGIKDSLAYAIYYGLITSLKLYHILSEINLKQVKKILDFGAGTGASLIALKFLEYTGDYYGYDINRFNLKILSEFAKCVNFKVRYGTHLFKDKYDLILVINTLNELKHPNVLKKIVTLLSYEGMLVIVEPGDKISAHRLASTKQMFVNLGLHCIFPCVNNAKCPLVNSNNWCHAQIEIERGDLLLEIDRAAGLNHHRVKYSILIFSKIQRDLPTARVINLISKGGKQLIQICRGDHIQTLSLSKKLNVFDAFDDEFLDSTV